MAVGNVPMPRLLPLTTENATRPTGHTRPVDNPTCCVCIVLRSSEPAKRGLTGPRCCDRGSTSPRPERGGGQVLCCRGPWPGLEGAALDVAPFVFGPNSYGREYHCLGRVRRHRGRLGA